MILLNLLPHREMARKRARQVFNGSLVGAVVIGALIAGLAYLWLQGRIDEQQARNAFLTREIAKLDQEIKEVASLQSEIAALKARQEAVENLQADRNMPVHLLNEAVRQLPDGLYLSKIKQENQNVLLEGVAQSNERVSELLRNLSRASPWITKPELIEIVAKNLGLGPREQRRVYNFTIRVQLQRASDAKAAAPGAAAGQRPRVSKGLQRHGSQVFIQHRFSASVRGTERAVPWSRYARSIVLAGTAALRTAGAGRGGDGGHPLVRLAQGCQ